MVVKFEISVKIWLYNRKKKKKNSSENIAELLKFDCSLLDAFNDC